MLQPYHEVYQWASELTCEQNTKETFFWVPQTRSLLRRLQITKNQLIAVIGLQGTGKSALFNELWTSFQKFDGKVIAVKWFGEEALIESIKDNIQIDLEFLAWELEDKMGKYKLYKWAEKNIPELKWSLKQAVEGKTKRVEEDPKLKSILMDKLGSKKLNEIMKIHVYDQLLNYTILIDLPDYDKNNRAQMIRDLNDIHKFWENINYDGSRQTNLVIFMQKELFQGHFFFGKMDVIEIEPFKSEQLVDFYEKLFGHTEPFTKDALLDLAVLSRGVFRRFKKYIRICLDYLYENGWTVITKDETHNTITLQQLHKDMELELSNLYPKSKEYRKYSVIVLQLLTKHGSMDQQDLAKELFGLGKAGEMKLSRILEKLEAYDYVKRENIGSNKKTVSLR